MNAFSFPIGVGRRVKSCSQSGQDVFAWQANGEAKTGTFVDIGANDPIVHNNTYALEQVGWRGICVDIAPFDYSPRKSQLIVADATKLIPALERFLKSAPEPISYLSLDADDATIECMHRLIPFFKFRALTVEHDVYRVGPERKNYIHDYLKTFGYRREHEDVKAPLAVGMPWSEQPFEDWYIL